MFCDAIVLTTTMCLQLISRYFVLLQVVVCAACNLHVTLDQLKVTWRYLMLPYAACCILRTCYFKLLRVTASYFVLFQVTSRYFKLLHVISNHFMLFHVNSNEIICQDSSCSNQYGELKALAICYENDNRILKKKIALWLKMPFLRF